MKKKLSILLVGAMVLSMIPTAAFADSTNTVSNAKMFKSGQDNQDLGNLTIKQDGATTADKAITVAGTTTWYEDFGGDIILNLENGSWKSDTYTALNVTNGSYLNKDAATAAGAVYYTRMSDSKLGVSLPAAFNTVGGTQVSVAGILREPASNATVNYYNIPLLVKTGDTEGDMKVTVERLDTQITATTNTVAIVAAGSTVSTVSSVKDLVVGESVDLDTIIVTETAIGAKDLKKIELVAPKGFYWSTTSVVSLSTLGGYAGTAVTTPIYSKYGETSTNRTPIYEFVDMNNDGDLNDIIGWIGSPSTTTAKNDMEVITLDLENATYTNPPANAAGSAFKTISSSTGSNRGVLVISGLKLNAEADATLGDVSITIKGDATEQSLKVAKCIDYGYTIAVADAKAIVSGAYDSAFDSSKHETAKITISEGTVNSWWLERATTFTFPEGVKVRGYQIKTEDMLTNITENKKQFTDVTRSHAYGTAVVKVSDDNDKVTVSGLKRTTSKAKLEIVFYVSVAADFDGDVNVTVAGSVLEPADKLIATSVQAISLGYDTKNVGIALQNVATSDLTIKENVKGILAKTGKLQIAIDEANSVKFANNGAIDAVVTEGDIEISKSYVKGNVLTLEIKRASTKPSTIVVSGLIATLDRTPAEGGYSVLAYGDAFLNNSGKTDDQFEYASYLEFTDYINVTTAAPDKQGTTTNKVVVTIGSKTYTINGEEATMDSAPIIANERTLVPTRAISEGLGYQVTWNEATRVATVISTDNRTASFTLGSKNVAVNGVAGVLTMDVAPVVTAEGRMLIPFRALGEALGINVEWDDATHTATYN